MSLATSSQNEIQLLRTSAAFSMSLGAKELFHTNFLAFLLESDDPSLVPIQLAIRQALGFSPISGAVPNCAVWREKNNLDLLVVELMPAAPATAAGVSSVADEEAPVDQSEGDSGSWDWSPEGGWQQSASIPRSGTGSAAAPSTTRLIPTNRVLLVEAKLKSIPRLDQLIDYDEQLASRGISLEFPQDAVVPEWSLQIGPGSSIQIERRLLSNGVSITTPATPKRPPGHWVGVTWKSLQSAMKSAISGAPGSSMVQTITDYTDSLGALVALIDRVHQMCDDAHRIPTSIPTYGALRKQPLDPQFKSLRINDLLGKALFDYWLRQHVIKAAAKINIPAGWALNSYVNYSNGTPGFGLELVNDRFLTQSGMAIELRIGVQIQDCEFRLFVDLKNGWSGLESWIAAHPRLLSDWFMINVFSGSPVGYRGKPVMPPTRSGRKTNLKVFDGNCFLYSKCDIDDQSVVSIVNEVVRVVAHASTLAPTL